MEDVSGSRTIAAVRIEAFQQFWGLRPNPPTITVAYVSGLANPGFLIEMDAVAVVPLA